MLLALLYKETFFIILIHNISFVIVLLTTEYQRNMGISPGLTTMLVLFSGLIVTAVVFFSVVFFGRGSQTRYPGRDKKEFTALS